MTLVAPRLSLRFGPFVLDSVNELVLRGRQRVPLTPKAFAVLRHLVTNSGRRVAKEELLQAIWPGVYVSDAVLKVCISEIRKALADDVRHPRFIKTVHWSDVATLDLVRLVAQRRQPARLLLLATYRPVDVAVSGHPLRTVKQELAAHRSCEELALTCLSETAAAEFLVARLGGRAVAQTLSALVHRRTEGHPLFMVNVVDFLRDHRLIVQNDQRWEPNDRPETLVRAVPESIRHAIERQIDSLDGEEVRVLQAAAVAGVEFSAAAIAVAVDGDVVRVEECCETMARRELFLRRRGAEEWPDGTVAARYEFIHSLYQNVLYQRTAASHRVLLHRRIGEREEAAWGEEGGAIAAELAAHFEEGRDVDRALRYLRAAAENAARRYANREAIDYLTRAQALVVRLPAEARGPLDMALRERLGMLRRAMGDTRCAADDFCVLACRAREEGHSATAARALFYLASTLSSIDGAGCLAAAGEAVELSRGVDDELLRAQTRGSSGYWHSFLRGWRREDAHACAEALATARTAQDPALLSLLLGRYVAEGEHERAFGAFSTVTAWPGGERSAPDGATGEEQLDKTELRE